MTTHTPGPWKVILPPGSPAAAGDAFRIFADQNNWGGSVANTLCSSPNAEANARLIAAAPDLLAALKIVEDASTSWLTLGERVQIRAAIAKAEGL